MLFDFNFKLLELNYKVDKKEFQTTFKLLLSIYKIYFNQLQNELAGLGGDIGFIKNEFDVQINVPLPNDIVSDLCYRSINIILFCKMYSIFHSLDI